MSRDVFLEMHREVEEWIRRLCSEGYTVVLFGSRARGEARIDSDWDLVIIGNKPPTEPPNDLAQVHYVTEEFVEREVMNFNTIFLDAFYEGKLICGDQAVFNRLRGLVLNVTKGFIKTRDGWVRVINK